MRRVSAALALVFAALSLAACTSSDVSRTIGARCDVGNECADRCLAPADEYPGGMCTVGCVDDGDCPDDAHCVAEEGGVCLFACDAEADCGFLGAEWTCASRASIPMGQVMVCRGS